MSTHWEDNPNLTTYKSYLRNNACMTRIKNCTNSPTSWNLAVSPFNTRCTAEIAGNLTELNTEYEYTRMNMLSIRSDRSVTLRQRDKIWTRLPPFSTCNRNKTSATKMFHNANFIRVTMLIVKGRDWSSRRPICTKNTLYFIPATNVHHNFTFRISFTL